MSKTDRGKEIQRLQQRLTEKQLRTLRKDNPFKWERNELITSLAKRGTSYSLLAELVGMSDSSILRIATWRPKRRRISRRAQVQRLRESLTKRQRTIIRGDNPCRMERDGLIYKLHERRGIALSILADLTGLSYSSILRITTPRTDKRQNKAVRQ